MMSFRSLVTSVTIAFILFACAGTGLENKSSNNKKDVLDRSKVKLVKQGSKVKVHYILKLSDGTVVNNTRDTGPLEVIVGEKAMFKGFYNALKEMELNEVKKVIIEPYEGYGKHDGGLVIKLNRGELFEKDLKQGKTIHITKDGITKPAQIIKIKGDIITVDFNHPMAGKTLHYEIEVISID
jgi:FKBP-type peptidyl-prolyl cis-trans isomerase SlpA